MTLNWLTGSVLLNIILLIIIIFKSSLNDIVKDKWQNIQQTKKEKQERLLDLRIVLINFKDAFNHLSQYAYAICSNNKSFQEVLDKQPIPKSDGIMFKSNLRHISLLPIDLHDAYYDIVGKSSVVTAEILYNKDLTFEEYQIIRSNINLEFDKAIELVNDYLKKYN